MSPHATAAARTLNSTDNSYLPSTDSANSSSSSTSCIDADSALAECEEEVQQLLYRRPAVIDSLVEERDAGPFAAAVASLSEREEQQQQQQFTADFSRNDLDSSKHKPSWQQQQQLLAHSPRHATSNTSSGSSNAQANPKAVAEAATAGKARSTLLRRRITVASASPGAAGRAAAAADDDDDDDDDADNEDGPIASVSSVPNWVFGAKQQRLQQQQQHTQSQASKLLHSRRVAGTSAKQHQQQQHTHKLKVLIAGYGAEEAANDLLPLLLEFAPAGSRVVVALARADHDAAAAAGDGQQQQQLPEGLDWEGQLEAEEEAPHAGGAAVLHCINYRCEENCRALHVFCTCG
jgi:hypothetical protein